MSRFLTNFRGLQKTILFINQVKFPRNQNYQFFTSRFSNRSSNDRLAYLASLLGISHAEASKLLVQNQILRQLNDLRLKNVYNLLQNMKLDLTQIIKKPQVFNYLPNTLEERHQCLQEIGFHDISIGHLLKFNTIMRCVTPVLRKKQFLKDDVDPITHILSHTNDPNHLQKVIKENYGDLSQANLGTIHHICVVEYLSWVLGSSLYEIKTLMEKYPKLKTRSLCSVMRTYVALSRHLEFNNLKIRQHGHLLGFPAADIHEKLTEFNLLAGVGFKWLANKHPKLLSISSCQLRSVVKLLQDYDITNEQIVVCSKILLLPSSTIKRRIVNIKKDPEVDKYRSHPQFLELLCTSRQNLHHWTKQFDAETEFPTVHQQTLRHIEYFYLPCKHLEVVLYITDSLGLPQTFVHEKLQPYPQWSWANLLNSSFVLTMLLQRGFNREQIIRGLPMILYNWKSVECHLDELVEKNKSEDVNDPFFLRKVLYSMEEKNYLSDDHLIEYTTETLRSKRKNNLRQLFYKCFNQESKE